MDICIIFFKTVSVLFLFLKETMEYEKPSIHSTMYQFNTYKIKLLAPPKNTGRGKGNRIGHEDMEVSATLSYLKHLEARLHSMY